MRGIDVQLRRLSFAHHIIYSGLLLAECGGVHEVDAYECDDE